MSEPAKIALCGFDLRSTLDRLWGWAHTRVICRTAVIEKKPAENLLQAVV
jgi:hypothetical protein